MHDKLHKKLFICKCSFLWIHESGWELVKRAYGEKLIYWKDVCCRLTLELSHRGNSSVHLQHMLLKIRRKLFGNSHFPSIKSIAFTSFKHLNLPISIKILVITWQIVYIYMTAISPNLISWTILLLSWYLHGSNYKIRLPSC